MSNNIEEYIILNKKNKFISFTRILFIIILLFLLLSNKLEYEKFYDITGIYNNFKVTLLVDVNKVNNFLDNNYIYIDNKKYEYNIYLIENELLIENYLNYQKIIIEIVNIPKKYQINNLVISFKKTLEKKKLIYYFKDFIWR